VLLVRTRRSLVGSRKRLKFVHLPVRGPALCDSRPTEVSAWNTDGGQDYGRPQKALAPRRREALLGQEALSRLEVGEEALDFYVAVEAVELLGDVVVEELEFG